MPKSVCVEAAHVYVGESFSEEHKLGAEIGADILAHLADLGIKSCAMLFIDDLPEHNKQLNPGCYSQDPEGFQASLNDHGFCPEKFVLESSLVQGAQILINKLEFKGIAKSRKRKSYAIGERRKVFPRFAPSAPGGGLFYLERVDMFNDTTPVCAVLDAALYLEKLRESDVCITVLSDSYKKEQERAKFLVRALGNKQTIINVYFNEEGEIDIDFDS
ncbi:hypothetical protein ISS86_03175 [Candidatus Microgenomates bacterium]|nr:hypothetical protein [Candidatus Microgenomates bacterium]